jgi:hypothetical protein
MQRFNLKLNDVDVKEQNQIKISHRSAALENLDDDDIWTFIGLGKVLDKI